MWQIGGANADRERLLLWVTAAACLLATSCSSQEPASSRGSATVTATVTASATATESPTDSGSSVAGTAGEDPGGGASGPAAIDGPVVRRMVFTSPTGNITCSMVYGPVCQADQMDYSPPPRPDDCEQDWGPFFYVGEDSGGFGICAGDPQIMAPTQLAALPYGTTSVKDEMACKSTPTGVVCWDTRSRHGFRVARSDYDLF